MKQEVTKARFPFKRNRLRCMRCVNENRKKRKRLRLNGNRFHFWYPVTTLGKSFTHVHKSEPVKPLGRLARLKNVCIVQFLP